MGHGQQGLGGEGRGGEGVEMHTIVNIRRQPAFTHACTHTHARTHTHAHTQEEHWNMKYGYLSKNNDLHIHNVNRIISNTGTVPIKVPPRAYLIFSRSNCKRLWALELILGSP